MGKLKEKAEARKADANAEYRAEEDQIMADYGRVRFYKGDEAAREAEDGVKTRLAKADALRRKQVRAIDHETSVAATRPWSRRQPSWASGIGVRERVHVHRSGLVFEAPAGHRRVVGSRSKACRSVCMGERMRGPTKLYTHDAYALSYRAIPSAFGAHR